MAKDTDTVELRWPKGSVIAKRGDVVFVQARKNFTAMEMRNIGTALKTACERYGVQIVVLPPELEVDRVESVAETGTPGIEPDAGGTGEHTMEKP